MIRVYQRKENDKMEKMELENLYEICKDMTDDDLTELLKKSKSYEEQAFYVAVSDFFLQQRQKEVIKKGIF